MPSDIAASASTVVSSVGAMGLLIFLVILAASSLRDRVKQSENHGAE